MKHARKNLIVLLASLAAVLASPDGLIAGSISYQVQIEMQGADINQGYLPQFGGNPGSLEAIYFSGTVGVGIIYIFGEPLSSVMYSVQPVLNMSNLPDYYSFFPVSYGTENFDPPAYSGSFGGTFNISGWLPVDGSFYGTGELIVTVSSNTNIDVPIESQLPSVAFGQITFTYFYSVPEPPSLVLASIAAILPLSLIVKKRFTKRANRT